MKGTILCVDDEPVVLHSLKAQLRRRFQDDFHFEMAESVDEALELLEDVHDPQSDLVVISDWLMPGMRGDEFLAQVSKNHPNAVLILLTGQADQVAITRARSQADLEECINKPWVEDVLSEVIANGLKRKRS